MLLSQCAVNGMQAGAGAEASEADSFPMHAVLREFNQSYAAAMTAEACARYVSAAVLKLVLGMLPKVNLSQSHNALCKGCKSESADI